MNRIILLLSFLILGVVTTQEVNALSITVNDNIADNLYLPSGSTVNGSFNIKPELLPVQMFNTPYDIQSGSYTFAFADDNDVSYVREYTTAWSGTDNNCYDETFTRTHYKIYTDAPETVTLQVTENIYSGATSYYETSIYTGQSVTYETDYFLWIIPLDTDTYITYSYNQTSGYKGNFTITKALTNADKLMLSTGGTLDFSITANGDLYYSQGKLDVVVGENPVPEPGTVILLGIGLLGLGNLLRRKNN